MDDKTNGCAPRGLTPPRHLASLLGAALFVVAVLCALPSAFGQTASDVERAKKLFADALALIDQGRPGPACPMLEESFRLDPGMGTQYHLAECYVKLGRLASAHALFVEVADWADREDRADRAEFARKRAQEIAPLVAKLQVVVPPEVAATPELEVTCNGQALSEEQWATALPVDLGKHIITAQAPDRQTRTFEVVVTEEGETTTVRVPPLALALVDVEFGVRPPAVAPTPPRSYLPEIVLGSVVLVGVGVGAGFFAAASGKSGDADDLLAGLAAEPGATDAKYVCFESDSDTCGEIMSLREDHDTFQSVGVVSLGIGGAALVAGLAHFFLVSDGEEPESEPEPKKPAGPNKKAAMPLRVAPWADVHGGGGLAVGGRF